MLSAKRSTGVPNASSIETYRFGRRRILRVDQVLARRDAAAAASRQHQRQPVRIVLVAVAERRPEQDHRIVQHRAFAFLHVAEFAQQIAVLLHVPAVDHGVLPQLLGIVGVVRDLVMRVGDAFEKTEIDAADGVAEHERADARGVALERERDQIQHEADVLLMAWPDSRSASARESSDTSGFHVRFGSLARSMRVSSDRTIDRYSSTRA